MGDLYPEATRAPSARYAGLLAAAFAEPSGILPTEAARLRLYRERNAITDVQHEAALQLIGWTAADYQARCEQGDEVSTYLHVVAMTMQQTEGRADDRIANRTLQLYRERCGVSMQVHVAAMHVLGLPVGGALQSPASVRAANGRDATAYAAAPSSAPDAPTSESHVLTYRKMLALAVRDERAAVDAQAAAEVVGRGADALSATALRTNELALYEFGAAHGIGASAHSAAFAALGGAADEADTQRGVRLEARLQHVAGSNAARRAELDLADAELANAHHQHSLAVADDAMVPSEEVSALEGAIREAEEGGADFRAEFDERRQRMRAVAALLDAREAELYETEEAVRELDTKERSRDAEIARTAAQLRAVEAAIGSKQRELLHAATLSDSDRASSTLPSWAPAPFGGADTELDVEVRALRRVARVARARHEGRGSVDTGYVHFHTLAMGIKLSMSEQPRLRNVTIDELWEDVQHRQLPQAEWRAFVRGRLVGAEARPRPIGHLVSAALDEVSSWLGALVPAQLPPTSPPPTSPPPGSFDDRPLSSAPMMADDSRR